MSGSTGGPMTGGPRDIGGKGPEHQCSKMNTYPPLKEESLHTDENRWTPRWKGSFDVTKSWKELETESLLKKVRGILNKVTREKICKLQEQLRYLPIDDDYKLEQTVSLVLSKAVNEPVFAVEYATLCFALQHEQLRSVSFRKLLMLQCQAQFERNEKEKLNIESRLKEIESCTDPSSKWKRSRWDASGLTIQDIVPKGEDVDAFLKEKELDFLVGEVTDDEPASGESSDTAGGKAPPAGLELWPALSQLKIVLMISLLIPIVLLISSRFKN